MDINELYSVQKSSDGGYMVIKNGENGKKVLLKKFKSSETANLLKNKLVKKHINEVKQSTPSWDRVTREVSKYEKDKATQDAKNVEAKKTFKEKEKERLNKNLNLIMQKYGIKKEEKEISENLFKLIDSIESDSPADFNEIFNQEMSSRINNLMNIRKEQLSSEFASYTNNANIEENEGENETEIVDETNEERGEE